MKYFIICSRRYAAAYRKIVNTMHKAGHELIHDWLAAEDIDLEIELRKDIHFIQQADAIIAIAPGGYDTQIELGIAIGAGKPILFFRPTYDSANPRVDSAYMSSSLMTQIVLMYNFMDSNDQWGQIVPAIEALVEEV